MIHQAFWLEYATLAWMTVEAAVAIASGIAANSLTLVAFGIDSVIELASAGVLVWRLTIELRYGQTFAESAERRASHIGGSLLFILAVYVVASAGWKLWTHQGAEFSLPGLSTDKGVDGTYKYECKRCGGSTKVHCHSDKPGGLSIVPDFR